jgi:hypothetical protein
MRVSPEANPVYLRSPQWYNRQQEYLGTFVVVKGLRHSIKNVYAVVNIVFHKHN